MIKYSFIIPVYNTKKYLERCVQSILQQSYQHYEILLINDGSTDGSGDLCDDLSQKDKRIKVFHQINSGVSTARNNGIKHALGDFFIFVDSDDWISINYLTCIENIISSSDSDIFCYRHFTSRCYIVEDKKNYFQPIQKITVEKYIKGSKFYPALWSYVFKRSIIQKHNLLLKKELKYSEDSNFIFKYLAHSTHITISNERLYYYFLRNDSAIHQNFTHEWAEYNLMACLDCLNTNDSLNTNYIKKIIVYYTIAYFVILYKMKNKDLSKRRAKEQFLSFCSITVEKCNIITMLTSNWCQKHFIVTKYLCCFFFFINRLKNKILQ